MADVESSLLEQIFGWNGETTMSRIAQSMLVGAGALAVGIGVNPGFAQGSARTSSDASSRLELEEVTVTARRREESLQDIPISIVALTAEQIEATDTYDVRDVVRLTPNVTLQTTGGAGTGRFNPNLTFRGLQNTFPVPRTQVGAVFLDGNYVLFGVNAINTADIERVEVLRGPQNAYFGRNTFAGAINFISKTPGDEFAGQVGATASDRGTSDLSASIEGPLMPGKLSGRLSVRQREKDGHYTALDGGRLGDESTKSVSASLFARPTEGLSIRLRGAWQEDDDGPGTVINLSPVSLGDTCRGRFIDKGRSTTGARGFNVTVPYFCDRVPGIDQLGERIVSTQTSLVGPTLARLGNPNGLADAFINNSLGFAFFDRVPRLDGLGLLRRIRSVNLQADYEFGNGINLGFNYGWQGNRQVLASDADRSNADVTFTYIPVISSTRTYELRLGSSKEQRLRWLLGATYFTSSLEGNYGTGGSGQWRARLLPTQPLNSVVQTSQQVSANPFIGNEFATVKALYGSVDWDVLDRLTLTAEFRRQEDASTSGGVSPPVFTVAPVEEVWKDNMPRVIGTFKVNEDWSVYASWSVGVLPGANNVGFTSQTPFRQNLIRQLIPDVQAVLESDELDSYEIGSKQTLLDGRLRYALSLYQMKWTNAKASSALVLPATSETNSTPFIIGGVTTKGDATIRGLELEATALLTDNWDIGGAVAYNKSELDRWGEAGLLRNLTGGQRPGANPGDVSVGATQWAGNEFARQPRVTGTLNSTYRRMLSNGWQWSIRGDMSYTGGAWETIANIVKSDDYYRVNARIGVERENLAIELFVTNLFDDNTWNYVSRTIVNNEAAQSINSILPLGNASFETGLAVEAPDKRDIGLRVSYKF
jgi:iron complex outermembrane recepter protein